MRTLLLIMLVLGTMFVIKPDLFGNGRITVHKDDGTSTEFNLTWDRWSQEYTLKDDQFRKRGTVTWDRWSQEWDVEIEE